MSTAIQRRRGTTAEHASFAGLNAELTVDTTKKTVVVHDGTTAGGFPLARQDFSNVTSLALPLGTAGAPVYSFTGDTNTGIYSPGADQVAISTGGSGRLFIDSSGRVGVGTSSLDSDIILKVKHSASSAYGFRVENNSGTNTITLGASDPEVRASGAPLYLTTATSQPIIYRVNNNEVGRFDTSGRLGIGTSAPGANLTLKTSAGYSFQVENASQPVFQVYNDTTASTGGAQVIVRDVDGNTGILLDGRDNANSYFNTGGKLGIGTTSPSNTLDVRGASEAGIRWGTTSNFYGTLFADATLTSLNSYNSNPLAFSVSTGTGFSEKARIDTSGRLLVGTSSALTGANSQFSKVVALGNSANNGAGYFSIGAGSTRNNGEDVANLWFTDNGAGEYASIRAFADGATGSSDYPGRLVFSTTADGAPSPTERMRIRQDGRTFFGTTDGSTSFTANTSFTILYANSASTAAFFSSYQNDVIDLDRRGNDGSLVSFRQDGTQEGTISVSGTTVSYNGAHLSRWSQLPSGTERTEILRGSVLSNLDEMCEWGDEDNEQLNRMKVSDVEGDKNVAGVFQAWDDDDDTYTNDFYCAMTGDFIIRIAADTTVERGDLLMSAGDGTAKPQDDDIVRSKTIAKVTSTNVSCTYDDGSYCVPCVLMAC